VGRFRAKHLSRPETYPGNITNDWRLVIGFMIKTTTGLSRYEIVSIVRNAPLAKSGIVTRDSRCVTKL
jgi:hypothetical protein